MPAPAPPPVRLADLAERYGAELRGDGEVMISGVASLTNAAAGQIAYYDGHARSALAATAAAAVVLSAVHAAETSRPCLLSDMPKLLFARLIADFQPPAPPAFPAAGEGEQDCDIAADVRRGARVTIGNGVKIGGACVLHDGVVIGDNAVIGGGGTLYPNVVIYPGTTIGERCVVHAGSVIGADGFGYVPDPTAAGRLIKFPQIGAVVIGDDVDIGAHTAIDRGALSDTVIGDGVKIDNQVQIGHNARVGAHSVICGAVGIAGSAVIGKNCFIGGGARIAGHITLGDGVQVSGSSTVIKDVPPGRKMVGTLPAMEQRRWWRWVGKLTRR